MGLQLSADTELYIVGANWRSRGNADVQYELQLQPGDSPEPAVWDAYRRLNYSVLRTETGIRC